MSDTNNAANAPSLLAATPAAMAVLGGAGLVVAEIATARGYAEASCGLCCNLWLQAHNPVNGSVISLRYRELEMFADKLNRLGQSGSTKPKRALDDTGLAANVIRDVEG